MTYDKSRLTDQPVQVKGAETRFRDGRHSSPSRPPGGSSGRDWGGHTVEEAALRHGAGVEEETDDPKPA